MCKAGAKIPWKLPRPRVSPRHDDIAPDLHLLHYPLTQGSRGRIVFSQG
jgi:hypothetical protein